MFYIKILTLGINITSSAATFKSALSQNVFLTVMKPNLNNFVTRPKYVLRTGRNPIYGHLRSCESAEDNQTVVVILL